VGTKGFSTSTCLPASRAARAKAWCVLGGVQRMRMWTLGSARSGGRAVWWVRVGWSAGAELPGVGVRCRMECRVRVGVRAMKGMWKTLAERLGGG
jgi:hypothetical protein